MLLESMCVKEEAKVSENELLHGVDFRLDGVLNLGFSDSRVGMTICRRCVCFLIRFGVEGQLFEQTG
jgi:hypothetical protein